MSLDVLPTRHGGAAENMAVDFLLLQRYPNERAPRFRHYGWQRPAFTFGYAQKFGFVQSTLPPDGPFDLCRRPTGGGIVDHRDDWTYSLVIPRGHPLEDLSATQSYREIHECLASALRQQDISAVSKPSCEPPADGGTCAATGVCFQRAELYDVIHSESGEKIAGAAQKRNKHGLLCQGSLWRPSLGREIDYDRLHHDFVSTLGRALKMEPRVAPWPDFAEDEISGLIEKYSAAEWMEFR
jgi:lipoate-protein ligase A